MLTLIKYDAIELSKKLLPAWIGLFAIALVQYILILANDSGIAKAIMFVVPLGIMVTFVVRACSWFNKTMFSERAYLTFTLPRSKASIILSKVIVTLIFTIITMALVGLLYALQINSLEEGAGSLLSNLELTVSKGAFYKAYSLYVTIWAITVFSFVMLVYLVISISSLLSSRKVLVGVLTFIGLYTVVGMLSSAIYNAFLENPYESGFKFEVFSDNLAELNSMLIKQVGLQFVVIAILTSIYVAVINYICKNKLNV